MLSCVIFCCIGLKFCLQSLFICNCIVDPVCSRSEEEPLRRRSFTGESLLNRIAGFEFNQADSQAAYDICIRIPRSIKVALKCDYGFRFFKTMMIYLQTRKVTVLLIKQVLKK